MRASNPYTLVFGQPPVEIIERTAQTERIVSEFCQDRPANYINLVTGVRGSGKTVFITQLANRFRSKKEWVVIDLNSQRDLLQSLAAKLDSDRDLNRMFREAEINLQAFGLGVEIKGSPRITDIEEALSRMLRSIKKHDKRVLITIDEANNSSEMRVFASAFQIFMRESLPVFLIMTGLYSEIGRLKAAKGMTFLERAPRTMLNPLPEDIMAEKYTDTLGIDMSEAMRLAKSTRGYSFAFQTLGYFCWEHPDDHKKAISDAKQYLFEFSYEKIWSELSGNDKAVAAAIAQVPSGNIAEIREKLNYSSNQFNPYRDRLLKSGIIYSPRHGAVKMSLPWFEDYIKKTEGL